MEVLAAQRALTIRSEEIRSIRNELDEKDRELMKTRQETLEEANGPKKLSELAQERIGDKGVGDLAIEKLELESARLEAEAASSALCKIANLSGGLLKQASLGSDISTERAILLKLESDTEMDVSGRNEYFLEAQRQVARLSALTEKLIKEAGDVVGAVA